MTMKTQTKMRGTALLTGGVIAVSSLTVLAAPKAQATTRDQYNAAAIGLGVLGVILESKGKTLPAVVAGAGAVYAYKKGQDTRDDSWRRHRYNRYDNSHRDNHNYRYDNRNNDNRYNGGNVYPDAVSTDRSHHDSREDYLD